MQSLKKKLSAHIKITHTRPAGMDMPINHVLFAIRNKTN